MKENKLTPAELKEYEEAQGSQAALDLLILAGPDGYTGNYEAAYKILNFETEETK